jgi:hypothetical protein
MFYFVTFKAIKTNNLSYLKMKKAIHNNHGSGIWIDSRTKKLTKVIYCKYEVPFLFCYHDGGKHLGDENLSVVVQGGRVLAQLLLLRPCHRTGHSNILLTYKGMMTLVFGSRSLTVLSESSDLDPPQNMLDKEYGTVPFREVVRKI